MNLSLDRTAAAVGGAVGTVAAFAADIMLYGGDVLAAFLMWFIADIDLVVQFLGYLSTLSRRVAWLPQGIVEDVYVALLVAFLAILVLRMAGNWLERRRS